MTSCLWLERPGFWRGATVAAILLFVALPSLPLLLEGIVAPGGFEPGAAFFKGLANSAVVAVLAGVISLGIGLPAGVLAGLYDFPARRALLALAALPLLVPSFLWAIGLS